MSLWSISSVVTNLWSANVQLEVLKRTVDRTASDLESTRAEVTQMKKEIQDKTQKYVVMLFCVLSCYMFSISFTALSLYYIAVL